MNPIAITSGVAYGIKSEYFAGTAELLSGLCHLF